MMAIVDAASGRVYPPPLAGAGTELYVQTDPVSDREIDFRFDSIDLVKAVLADPMRNGKALTIGFVEPALLTKYGN
jgi:hypothetical protein